MSANLALIPESATPACSRLTAELKKAITRGDSMVVRFTTPSTRQSWENKGSEVHVIVAKDVKLSKKSKLTGGTLEARVKDEYEAMCNGSIRNGCGDKLRHVAPSDGAGWTEYERSPENVYSPDKGNWHVYIGPNTPAGAIFEWLPVGCALRFEVLLDYSSNGYLAKAGIHGDALLLVVTHKQKKREFILDTQNVPMNGIRFGQ